MHAAVGDTLVIHGPHTGDTDHTGEIVGVGTPEGDPPFTVRWDDTGHEVLVFPGPDAVVRPARRVGSRGGR